MTVQARQPLSKEDVCQLIDRYKDHPTEEIKTRLVLHFAPLVRSLARRFAGHEQVVDDLVQVGMIGLLAALSRFDREHSRTFESFAVPTIVGEIKRYIRDKTWSVHVPRRIKEMAPKIKQAIDELTGQLGRSPRIGEIAKRLDVSEEEVRETVEMIRSYKALSIDTNFESDGEGSTVSLLEMIGVQDRGFEEVHRRILFEKLLPILTEKEQQVIQLTYYEGLSQQEAGLRLNISQMHVSRLQRRALHKLRETMRETGALTSTR
jgi:RNA polymerase sigma-B factor